MAKTILITYPTTTYTNPRLRELGAPAELLRERNRTEEVKGTCLLGKNMRWGETTQEGDEVHLTITYTGRVPKAVEEDLTTLQERGVITSYSIP